MKSLLLNACLVLGVMGFAPLTLQASYDVTITIIEWTVPWPDTRPRDPDVAPDGSIWLVGQGGHYAMAIDAKDRVWFVETRVQPNLLVGFDPATESFFVSAPIPSGAGAVRHMVYDEARNSLWFGTDTNNLGQARLP